MSAGIIRSLTKYLESLPPHDERRQHVEQQLRDLRAQAEIKASA